MDVVATVMLHGEDDIPTVNTVGVLGAAAIRKFMNYNVGSGRIKGGLAEIKCAMQLGVR